MICRRVYASCWLRRWCHTSARCADSACTGCTLRIKTVKPPHGEFQKITKRGQEDKPMRTMSGLDGAFLHIETEETPMHVGALYLLERPADQRGSYFEAVKQRLAPRLAQSSFFKARLAAMPLQFANPVWIEDRAPNMAYHLRQVLLPKPGSMQQLQDKVGELHSTLLDRNHPLWEVTVI
ncbi:MAG: hypothetical protein EKK59_11160, partial [Neisseriaceae bacterium]